jgi:hypothetical protein
MYGGGGRVRDWNLFALEEQLFVCQDTVRAVQVCSTLWHSHTETTRNGHWE